MPLRLIFLLAALNLTRSWRTTAVLSVLVVSAVAALIFINSLAIGTTDAMVRNSVGLYSGHITADSVPDSTRLTNLADRDIATVLTRKQHKVVLKHDDAVAPVLLVGVDPESEQQATALPAKKIAGIYLGRDQHSIFLSSETAQQLHAAPGDQLSVSENLQAAPTLLVVAGIFATGISHLDQTLAFTPLAAYPFTEDTSHLAVFVRSGADVEAVRDRCRRIFAGIDFQTWMETMPDLKQLIDLNLICLAILMVLVFAIVAVGISCAFLIFTLKNLREHGIMKAMGVLPSGTAMLLLCQIGMLTSVASIIGLALGGALVALYANLGIDLTAFTSHNQYFTVSGIIYPRLTASTLLAPPLLALVFGLVAAILPAIFILRKNPADIIRSV